MQFYCISHVCGIGPAAWAAGIDILYVYIVLYYYRRGTRSEEKRRRMK